MEQELRVRVISWNLHHRVEPAAAEEAALIAELSPDIACLQEVNVNSITVLEAKSGVALLTAPARTRCHHLDGRPTTRSLPEVRERLRESCRDWTFRSPSELRALS